jgi:hypothetical protein
MADFNEMVMNPDIQEAESHKYSDLISMVLPLESGKYALFGPHRKLYVIVDDWFDLGAELNSKEYKEWKDKEVANLPVSPSMKYEDILEVKVDVGDLGL